MAWSPLRNSSWESVARNQARSFISFRLRRDGRQPDPACQSGLANVERAEFRGGEQLRRSHMNDVQGAAAHRGRVGERSAFGLEQYSVPQPPSGHEQARGEIVFDLLPG